MRTYVKHHSFQTFWSRLNVQIPDQRQRVLDLLKESIGGSESDDERIRIWQAAFADLGRNGLTNEKCRFRLTQNIADELSRLPDEKVSTYIFHRYRYDIFPQTKELDSYPPYLQIEPTSICNYRCVFCYQTDPHFHQKSNKFMGSMPYSLFEELIDRIHGHIEFISLASRGEPFLCKDIGKMLRYCEGKFLGLKVNTNASLLTEEHCHALLGGGVNTVVFSADAADEPLYSQLRIGGKLSIVQEKITMFESIRRRYYPRSAIIARVSGVKVSEEQDIDSMVGRWGELVDQVAFVKYNPWENVYEAEPSNVHAPCSDLWRRMFVWFDGRVNPCDTDYMSTLSVGSIEGRSIPEVWNSAEYQKLRDSHTTGQRRNLSPCGRCTVV